MNYVELTLALRRYKMYLFALEDVKNLFPKEKVKTIKNNISRWLSKGYFVRLKRDLYEFVQLGVESKIPDLYVANRLYEPAYVSLETALSVYSVIPDIAAGVTSVTARPTRTFKDKYGAFFYRSCKKKAFTGYGLITYEGFKVCIADKEKALVDFLYYSSRLSHSLDFNEERLNKKILKNIDWKKAYHYAKLFNDRTLKLVKECKEYVKC